MTGNVLKDSLAFIELLGGHAVYDSLLAKPYVKWAIPEMEAFIRAANVYPTTAEIYLLGNQRRHTNAQD